MPASSSEGAHIAVLMHDGFYGAGTGAGYANRAFLQVLTRARRPGTALLIMPVHLTSSSREYDPAWHQDTLRLLDQPDVRILPADNGTAGRVRFGGLTAFRHLGAQAASALTRTLAIGTGPLAIFAFDVPFLGVPPLLPPSLARHLVVIPRSTALLHDPGNTARVDFERLGLLTTADQGGRVAAISAHMRQHLHYEYGIPEQALTDLADGLTAADQDFAAPDPALLPRQARDGFILAMGRAQPYKGWDDLIEALHQLRQRRIQPPHAILAAVAEEPEPTPYQRHLAGKAAMLGLDVTVMTRFDHRIRGLLTHPALKAVVVPSRTEPFGRIPLEAYAAGAAPVVATTAGGLAGQVIDTVTGYTAQPANPASLAEAIRRALATSEQDRERMRTRGRELLYARFDHASSATTFLRHVAPWALPSADPARTA